MDEPLHNLNVDNTSKLNTNDKSLALQALEAGKVIFMPALCFKLPEAETDKLLSEAILDGKHKNISFDIRTQRIGGLHKSLVNTGFANTLGCFMQNFAEYAHDLVSNLFSPYQSHLIWGRTSYRPAEVRGRPSSKRKDDTRLHIDSFAATPVNGQRILRVFCNVNPYGEPRVWQLGEAFPFVAKRFSPRIPAYNPTIAKLLHKIKVTKSLRSAYDHYQLHLHDGMKLDEHYQNSVNKKQIDFPAQSTWMVFTDQVSHAALGGQYLLEQTFYLPVSAMDQPARSPLHFWEREKGAFELNQKKAPRYAPAPEESE